MLMLLLLFIFGLSLLAIVAGVMMLLKRRDICRTPLTLTSCTAPGPLSLQGTAESFAEMRAPFTDRPCVYCEYKVEQYSVSGRGRHRMPNWDTVHESHSKSPFRLRDGAGGMLICPTEAHVDIEDHWTFDNYRASDASVTKPFPPAVEAGLNKLSLNPYDSEGNAIAIQLYESILPAGAHIYVHGECSTDAETIRTALGYAPDEAGETIKAIITSGDAVDQVYIGYGTIDEVRWRLLWQGALCLLLGPIVALITGSLLFGGCSG